VTPIVDELAHSFQRIADTRYADFEVRPRRETFTKKLERICKLLDPRHEVDFEMNGRYQRESWKVRGKLKTLWAAGSYARGALTCGDLDLIADIEVVRDDGTIRQVERDAVRELLGSIPLVRVYRGTPEANSSRVAMPDAVAV
jgi:hypothetical protein